MGAVRKLKKSTIRRKMSYLQLRLADLENEVRVRRKAISIKLSDIRQRCPHTSVVKTIWERDGNPVLWCWDCQSELKGAE